MRIVILTDIPSPYQVEFFNALVQLESSKMLIVYNRKSAKNRAWQTISMRHEHFFLDGTHESEIVQEILGCDLVVFGGYRDRKSVV